jgi:hypothetical protein
MANKHIHIMIKSNEETKHTRIHEKEKEMKTKKKWKEKRNEKKNKKIKSTCKVIPKKGYRNSLGREIILYNV